MANLAPSEIAVAGVGGVRTVERTERTERTENAAVLQQEYDYGELTEALQQLKARLDEPIVAETYATGKGGTMTAQELVEKMNSNASRPRRR